MVNDDQRPPRKKSRFFSNGKSKIESLVRRSIRQASKNEHPTSLVDSESDGETSMDVGNLDRRVSAAREVKFISVRPDSGSSSPNLSTGAVQGRLPQSLAAIHGHNSKYPQQYHAETTSAVKREDITSTGYQMDGIHGPQGCVSRGDGSFTALDDEGSLSASNQPTAIHRFSSYDPSLRDTKTDMQPNPPRPGRITQPQLLTKNNSWTGHSQFKNTSAQYEGVNTITSQAGDQHAINQAHPQLSNSIRTSSQSIQNSFDPFASLEKIRPSTSAGPNCSRLAQLRLRPDSQLQQPESRHQEVISGSRAHLSVLNHLSLPVTRDNHSGYQNPSTQLPHPLLTTPGSIIPQSLVSGTDMGERKVTGFPSLPPQSKDDMPDPRLAGHPVNDTAIDLDRDASGVLLPSHLRRFAVQNSISHSHVRNSDCKISVTPANLYTSPKRTERTIALSRSKLKRKHDVTLIPPPAHIYRRSNDPNFNIFAHGFLLYPELCLILSSQMPLRDLISLYAISKDFHTIIDSRFTTVCIAQALRKAPESAQAYRFRSYAQYCRQDPAARIPHPNPKKAALNIPRRIPSFRWVAFVLHREKVVHELLAVFAERGCPLPARCGLALKKVWMIFDIPDNARRVAIIHNHRIFTDLDLYFLMCFFVKLDMVANDPVATEKGDGLRKLLLSQRGGLDVVLGVLKRDIWRKRSDFLLAWVRTMMSLEILTPQQLDEMDVDTVFGVPRDQVGVGKYEYWGLKGITDEITGRRRQYLLRPDQLVMREAVRRGMRLSKHFLRFVLYGYVRPDTLENYEPREYGRRIADWKDEEYDDIGVDGGSGAAVGGLRALPVEDGGDVLLDLGDKSRGSKYTIRREVVGEQERAMREGQDDFRRRMYRVSEEERGEQVYRRDS